jgi:hypothetical protein
MQKSKSHVTTWLAGGAILAAVALAGCTQYGGKNPEALPMEKEATAPKSTNSGTGTGTGTGTGSGASNSNTTAKTAPAPAPAKP